MDSSGRVLIDAASLMEETGDCYEKEKRMDDDSVRARDWDFAPTLEAILFADD